MAEFYTVGVDPSSRLVASIITHEVCGRTSVDRHAIHMPAKEPARTCRLAYVGFRKMLLRLAEQTDQIGVFIEAPTLVGRAGANALIPQAQVNGVLLAAAMSVQQVTTIENVPIGQWKRAIVKNGNANKKQIKMWCAQSWRDAYDLADGTQDFYDAAGINRFGDAVMRNINNMRG